MHVGVGAFHRCHQAEYFDDLAAIGGDWGIIGVNVREPDVCGDLGEQDGLYTRVLRHTGHPDDLRIVGSIIATVPAASAASAVSPASLVGVITRRDVDVVMMTVTEKGYCHVPATGHPDETNADLLHDLQGRDPPRSTPGLLADAMAGRAANRTGPITLVSCDNVSGNGVVLETMVRAVFAARYPHLRGWLDDEVGFASTMVDRIVPATDVGESERLAEQAGVIDTAPVVGEPFRQWILQNTFRGSRPPLETVGVEVVDDVEPYEVVKFRLVNGAQSMLSYLGALADVKTTAAAAAHPVLRRFVEQQLAVEVQPSLPAVAFDVDRYRSQVIDRVLNQAIHHTCHQIATDGSRKIVPRFVHPLRDALAAGRSAPMLALGIAAWIRYQLGVTDGGKTFVSNDPAAMTLAAIVRAAGSEPLDVAAAVLQVADIFGDLSVDRRAVAAVAAGLSSLHARGAIGAARAVSKEIAVDGGVTINGSVGHSRTVTTPAPS